MDLGSVSPLEALVAKDLRVASVAYRLQTAAVSYCARHQRLSGLLVQDISQYRGDLRQAMAASFGLDGLPAIVAVVPGSPGAAAELRSGDGLLAIDGRVLAEPRDRLLPKPADGARYTEIVGMLDRAFMAGPVAMEIRRGSNVLRVDLDGAEACASDVQLDLSGQLNAAADGQMVTISRGLLDAMPSDDELAFVIGHELAHNILGHRHFLEAEGMRRYEPFSGLGRSGNRLRETEKQADYLGLYLVAWAGYDVRGAAELCRHLERADPLIRLFSDWTHPGIGARIEALSAEAANIDAVRAAGGRLWPDPARLQTPR